MEESENMKPSDPASVSAIAITALMMLKGIGRRGALHTISERALELDEHDLKDFIIEHPCKHPISRSELDIAWGKSVERIERSREAGQCVLSFYDKTYPERLRDTPDPPAVVFVRGDATALTSEHTIAVVGTREPTEFGIKAATRSGKEAAREGFAVVSGLAHGCDTFGHQGCVDANGVGIAVLAHGLDRVYPAANRFLVDQLLDHGGCLVSEYAIGSSPTRAAFAERDRIQSGLSDGVLVIETGIKGGTMHTVNFSRAQHRPLACIAHQGAWLSEEKTKGNQKLIEDGWALPIADSDALLRFMRDLKAKKVDRELPAVATGADLEKPVLKDTAEPEREESDEPKQISMRF